MSTPIQPHTIQLILQYIAPPSLLTCQPLPPHLISKPLLQRHHFLQLSPQPDDDSEDTENASAKRIQEYLSWPSSSHPSTIAILESLPLLSNDDGEQISEWPVRYTSDSEYTYAHVHVHVDVAPSSFAFPSSFHEAVRLVFQWDDRDSSWKYHDLALMPFPPGAQASLAHALSAHPASFSLPVPSFPTIGSFAPSVGDGYESDNDDDGDDDEYWNAYGAASDQEEQHEPRYGSVNKQTANSIKSVEEAAEDAYWAQYSSVQGTADSTIPSPRRADLALQGLADPEHDELDLNHPNDFETSPPSSDSSDPSNPTNQPISRQSPLPELAQPIHPLYAHNQPRSSSQSQMKNFRFPLRRTPSPAAITQRLNSLSPRPSHPGSALHSRAESPSRFHSNFHTRDHSYTQSLHSDHEEDEELPIAEIPHIPDSPSSSEGSSVETKIISPRPLTLTHQALTLLNSITEEKPPSSTGTPPQYQYTICDLDDWAEYTFPGYGHGAHDHSDDGSSDDGGEEEEEAAVRESVKGLWRLFRAGRKGRVRGRGLQRGEGGKKREREMEKEREREEFLRIVRDVIGA
ncbi:hypothetical protein JAAARDRAFT_75982 [Jaapia argillacea MUCL 33604]|uniref:Uncharacterized protein n=1 Tax=Jaapia argillacea MUCL 33604 TaxID=933084 RepID=A0A067QC31_9AGAM|nr:hypothetical protein JAAARDRAFT_75982 [Jaapia argillacea MUCL 33604]